MRNRNTLMVPSDTGRPAFAEADIAEWMRFRQTYGLRSDREWVLQVARNPVSATDLSVPLLPSEIDLVATTNPNVQALSPRLRTYGETFPDEYAGIYIDETVAVITFASRLQEHEAAIAALFGPTAPIEVREVRYSWQELERFAQHVEAARDWFRSIDVELIDASPEELTNLVVVRYEADPNDDIEPLIRRHFSDPDWLSPDWYGPPPWGAHMGILSKWSILPGARLRQPVIWLRLTRRFGHRSFHGTPEGTASASSPRSRRRGTRSGSPTKIATTKTISRRNQSPCQRIGPGPSGSSSSRSRQPTTGS